MHLHFDGGCRLLDQLRGLLAVSSGQPGAGPDQGGLRQHRVSRREQLGAALVGAGGELTGAVYPLQ